MSTPFRFGSAISLIAMSTMIASCAASQQHVAAKTHFGGKTDENLGLATQAAVALSANKIPQAIGFAERAVARTPDDAGIRALLGNAYFAGGRFHSAASAYKDALTIYSNQPQAVLKLALAEIAQGKNGDALAVLDAGRDVLDPVDYGLALALAGQPGDAIPVLENAARNNKADSRTRQNLALAYALSGNWTQARTIASQDVPANQLDARIQQWMQLASPKHPSDQVAALVGVTPAATDQGEPVQLALRPVDQRLAQAAPVAAPAPASVPRPARVEAHVVAAPVPVSVSRPAPVEARVVAVPAIPAPALAPALAPAPQFAEAAPPPVVAAPPPPPLPAPVETQTAAASPAPVTMALLAAAEHVRSAITSFLPHAAAPAARPARVHLAAAPRPLMRSATGAVIQLGAYKSPQRVAAAWKLLTDQHPALRGYLPMRAQFVSAKGTFWRLSITGFASQRDAIGRCQLLRSRGGSCFVRNFAGDQPVQYASR